MYVDVIIPFPIPSYYTYKVPAEFEDEIEPGKRVLVPFGKSKIYTALIRKLKKTVNPVLRPKAIEEVLDDLPLVDEIHFLFWEWLADYYMSTVGEVMNAALPSAFKLSSESHFVLSETADLEFFDFTGDSAILYEALKYRKDLSLKDIQSILSKKSVYHAIKPLLESNVITSFEHIDQKYKPKLLKVLFPGEAMEKEELETVFDSLKRAPKQLEALMYFIEFSRNKGYCEKQKLTSSGFGSSIVKSMVDKGILLEKSVEVSRLRDFSDVERTESPLASFQEECLHKIDEKFEDKRVVLLHGITSSGKTHIYIEKIKECIKKEQQVLYLLPEIALTAQIVDRLRRVFGDDVGLYHSKFNDNERVEIWNRVRNKKYKVILGARSAIFLPFRKLDLIIVDEEHDQSFKQFDPAPRYNARDSAVMLAEMFDAKVLLGTATPSFESYYNARKGKYGFVHISKRYGDIHLPHIEIINLKEQYNKKLIRSNISSMLFDEIGNCLINDEQVILFQNRRGYAPLLFCENCGWTPQCSRCDVSLTYHRFIDSMVCHLCGFRTKTFQKCKACESSTLQIKGFGTEKIETDLSIMFPNARIGRLDYDTARGKYDHEKIIHDFQTKEINILVGTQMVSKGLDFDGVSLVGIIHADQILYFPDFRANERAFQLLTQVSGRSGRKKKRGKVLIQTFSPNHHVIRYLLQNDYNEFYKEEMLSRNAFKYPPAYRLIHISVKHKKIEVVEPAAATFFRLLGSYLQNRVLGPTIPNISRIKNLYIRDILVKLESKGSLISAKKNILASIDVLKQQAEFKSVQIHLNVDP